MTFKHTFWRTGKKLNNKKTHNNPNQQVSCCVSVQHSYKILKKKNIIQRLAKYSRLSLPTTEPNNIKKKFKLTAKKCAKAAGIGMSPPHNENKKI